MSMENAGACKRWKVVSLFGFQGAGSADAPLAQLVEQLTLNQWVPGSNPCRRTIWPVGQAVKTAASHAANMGSIPVRVTNENFISVLVTSVIKIVGAD